MADINVTPLVDVMLVLLIIFMITAPVLALKIKVDLPQPNPNIRPPAESAGSDPSEDRSEWCVLLERYAGR
jgi:biopolymer transport protein ExbD